MTGMRRALWAAVTLALAAAPASHATVQRVVFVERADAQWILEGRDGGLTKFEVHVWRTTAGDDARTIATFTRSACKEDPNGESLRCGRNIGSYRSVEGEPSEFSLSEDLSHGHVVLQIAGQRLRSAWASSGTLVRPYAYDEVCPEGSGTGRGLHRDASANGSFFGADLGGTSSRWSTASVRRGVASTACSRAQDATASRRPARGLVR